MQSRAYVGHSLKRMPALRKGCCVTSFAQPDKNKDTMIKLTVLTVAVAAGLTTFAANAHAASAKTSKTTTESSVKKSAGKAKSASKAKAISKAKANKEAAAGVDKMTTASIGGMETTKSAATSKGGAQYGTIIERYATSYGVPVSLAHAVIRVESNYRANSRGAAGEIGLMQIKPATARMMGYSGNANGLFNPETNIKFGMKYLAKAHELGGGTTCGTILKYNAGHGAKRMNPISSAYCSKVKKHLGGA